MGQQVTPLSHSLIDLTRRNCDATKLSGYEPIVIPCNDFSTQFYSCEYRNLPTYVLEIMREAPYFIQSLELGAFCEKT